MLEVVGVVINENGNPCFFNTCNLELKKGDNVIVDTEKGLQYGQVVIAPYNLNLEDLGRPLNDVVRIATKKDNEIYQNNKNEAISALKNAKDISIELGLDMHFINSFYTFDRKQLLFSYLADSRVDFRELAKRLAKIYRTRIELRQIGVRDKAKEVGGLGPCGRFLCCSTFLTDLNSVSINMAKNQMLALNPAKINGACGRLLCCLNYEDEMYDELRKNMPSINENYNKNGIEGKVVDTNLLKKTVTIETKNKTLVEVSIK